MKLRQAPRIFLHLLLVMALVIPGGLAPAQAASDAVATLETALTGGGMDMELPASDAAPCDCCTPHDCDLAACLGTACLPTLPAAVAAIPSTTPPLTWRRPAVPAGLIETPLRPPIA